MSPFFRPLGRVLARGSYREAVRIGALLRKETTGGVMLMLAALIAIIWANCPASGAYFALRKSRHIAGWHPDASAQSLIDSILGEWRMFIGTVVPDDDVSIAVVKRTATSSH